MKENNEDLEARIAAYIDGQLPSADAARLEVFLANTDPALAQQVIGMIAERHAVRALPKPKAPEDLAARIMEQVERASLLSDVEHFAIPRRPWWQSRAAVAAALILVLGGFTWFIVETVRRPASSWRETVMDEGARREDIARRDMAAAPAAAPATTLSSIPLDATTASANAATLAAADATASPASTLAAANAAPLPITAASPLPQSNTVAANSQASEQPVLLALVARDSDDYSRLRSRLEEFLAADPEATRNQLALNNKDVSDSLRRGSLANVGGQAAPLQTSQNTPAQSNSNLDEQFAARAAAKSLPAPEQSNSAYQLYNQRQRAFTPNSAASNESGTANSVPLPYRVLLRPDQFQQLAREFQLQAPLLADRAAGQLLPGVPMNTAKSATRAGTGLAKEKSTEPLIDCIITMAPPPSTTAPASQPGR